MMTKIILDDSSIVANDRFTFFLSRKRLPAFGIHEVVRISAKLPWNLFRLVNFIIINSNIIINMFFLDNTIRIIVSIKTKLVIESFYIFCSDNHNNFFLCYYCMIAA